MMRRGQSTEMFGGFCKRAQRAMYILAGIRHMETIGLLKIETRNMNGYFG